MGVNHRRYHSTIQIRKGSPVKYILLVGLFLPGSVINFRGWLVAAETSQLSDDIAHALVAIGTAVVVCVLGIVIKHITNAELHFKKDSGVMTRDLCRANINGIKEGVRADLLQVKDEIIHEIKESK